MISPDDQANWSGFARFPDRTTRDSFVRSRVDPDPRLKKHAYLPESQPTVIVFEQLTSAERDLIRSTLKGIGQWFDDVQFQTMS